MSDRPVGERAGAAVALTLTGLVAAAIVLGAVRNLASGQPVLVAIGAGMLVITGVGVLLVLGEVRLGRDTGRLARRLEAEGGLPVDPPDVERRPSGRLSREDADRVFAVRQAEVEAAPQDWRTWYRLALAYGDARDTSRGRRAAKRAVELERAERAGQQPG